MGKTYRVVRCKKCGAFMLALAGRKTRTCPRCGYRLNLLTSKSWFETENPRAARAYAEARNKLGPEAPEGEVLNVIKQSLKGGGQLEAD